MSNLWGRWGTSGGLHTRTLGRFWKDCGGLGELSYEDGMIP